MKQTSPRPVRDNPLQRMSIMDEYVIERDRLTDEALRLWYERIDFATAELLPPFHGVRGEWQALYATPPVVRARRRVLSDLLTAAGVVEHARVGTQPGSFWRVYHLHSLSSDQDDSTHRSFYVTVVGEVYNTDIEGPPAAYQREWGVTMEGRLHTALDDINTERITYMRACYLWRVRQTDDGTSFTVYCRRAS